MTIRMQINHLFDRWSVWAMVVLCTAHTITIAITPELEGPLNWALWPIVIAHVLGLWFLGRQHEPVACGACWKRFPINPEEQAVRRARPSLAYVHVLLWVSDRLRRIPFLDGLTAGLLATLLLMVAVTGVARIFIGPPWISMVTLFYVLFFVHSARRHAQLQPWCPWCRRGDDGDEEPEEPDPQPSTGIDLKPAGVH
jgi:hypothetical protein